MDRFRLEPVSAMIIFTITISSVNTIVAKEVILFMRVTKLLKPPNMEMIPEILYTKAEIALYESKKKGKNQYHFYGENNRIMIMK
ncbi:hypothetical protein [Niallia sp. Krafla_26]|uniref:hypothetical protein n=1 Tax=Niallia sp. Krafla_26 TaxID=3064703 RepID=UPI003D17A76C